MQQNNKIDIDKLPAEYGIYYEMQKVFGSNDIFIEFLSRIKSKPYIKSFHGYDIHVHKYWDSSIVFSKFYKTKEYKHRYDGPAEIRVTYAKENNSYYAAGIQESWYIENTYLPDWIPRVKNGQIVFDSAQTYENKFGSRTWRVDKKSIMDIVFNFNRNYGLYLDDIYEKLLKEKKEGTKLLRDLVDTTLNDIKGRWVSIDTYLQDITSIFLGNNFNKYGPQAKALYILIGEILSEKFDNKEIEIVEDQKMFIYRGIIENGLGQ